MRITKIAVYTVKAGQIYAMAGGLTRGEPLPGSDYRRFAPHRQLYSSRSQAALVRVETENGLVGWGEAQVPIGSEVVETIVREVLAPVVLGQDAKQPRARYRDMYETLRVRGQTGGFQADAIAAVDTAIWDVAARAAGLPLAEFLGGRLRDTLPLYVTGLRKDTPAGRQAEAADWARQGFGVKPCLGLGVKSDSREIEGLRSAMGDDAMLALDGMWAYTLPEACKLGRTLEAADVAFFESALAPEDVTGHARLAATLDIAVAVGEPLRTRHHFRPWLEAGAMDVAQPDLMRNGIVETLAIANLAEAFHLPVALHTGVVTVVGLAATWQVAASLGNFLVQEYQPVMLDTFNPWLAEPLRVAAGQAIVPTGPGLGIEIDEERLASMVTSSVKLSV